MSIIQVLKSIADNALEGIERTETSLRLAHAFCVYHRHESAWFMEQANDLNESWLEFQNKQVAELTRFSEACAERMNEQ